MNNSACFLWVIPMPSATISFDPQTEQWSIARHNDSWEVIYDKYTGDWIAMDPLAELPQQRHFPTRGDAFNYVFEKLGVVDDADYSFSPDRTSAQ